MPSVYTEIEINAPRAVVWQALVHKEDWLRWNTFLFDRSPNQQFERGRSLLLSLKRVAGEDETEFQAKITQVHSDVCLQWVSTAPGFRNEHIFELQDIGRGWTKYTHREQFSGFVTRLALPFIRQDEQQGLRRMARELKQHVELLVR
ncbi:MAG: SRPBCC domain-containing protein [Oculatellaceae cyanobacterium bins.114]|nr:SRPBCC domain-containing protein [Oculatellaceae cyanobacterium bins.114]